MEMMEVFHIPMIKEQHLQSQETDIILLNFTELIK